MIIFIQSVTKSIANSISITLSIEYFLCFPLDRSYIEMSALKVIVFLGTVRENRVGIRVANFILNHLKETNHDVELFGKGSFTLTDNDIANS